jgi:hypothetical protein
MISWPDRATSHGWAPQEGMQTITNASNPCELNDADLDQVDGGCWRLPFRLGRPVKMPVRPKQPFTMTPLRTAPSVPEQSAPLPRPELEPLPPTFTFGR